VGGLSVEEEEKGGIARFAVPIAVLGAAVLAAVLLFGGGGDYTVKARFLNAGQLVKGNYVEIGGTQAGEVKDFRITEDGLAEIEFSVEEKYAPLRAGVRAIIRQGSLSSTSNRYIELFLPSEREAGPPLDDGDVIDVERTTAGVELDQLFSILDRPTRKALRNFYKGGQRQYAGRGEAANRGLRYLSPQLNASSKLFEELSYEPVILERFLVDTSRFVTALADRRNDLSALIGNLNQTTRALGDERVALAEAIERLPGFFRQANTTYVNLRGTLDELDPFVAASKPVARRLLPYLRELRPFTQEAVPTVRALAAVTGRPGPGNDLRELNRTYPALASIALDTKDRSIDFGTGAVDLGEVRGAFPELSQALERSTPTVAHGRPYTPDFVGWMDDFSHTGAFDALGSFSRVHQYVNAFSVTETGFAEVPLADRGENFKALTRTKQVKRCPGGAEEAQPDGSNVWSPAEQEELDCVEAHRATGNYQP
jgi:phospholipid/cholesterol/gamma-HCH transport system substrate-binding protein